MTLAQQRDLWASSGPGVLAWSYEDEHPDCDTVYTVFVAHPGGKPRLQLKFADGSYLDTVVVDPERFGEWHTPRKFAEWARRWKDNTAVEKSLTA